MSRKKKNKRKKKEWTSMPNVAQAIQSFIIDPIIERLKKDLANLKEQKK